MSNHQSVSIDTSSENKGPSPQESYDQLVEEGLIAPEEGQETKKETEAPSLPSEETGVETSGRPEWLPEKFKTPEDMAKSYAELEKKLSGKKDEDGGADEVDEAREATEEAGLNFDDYSAEYAENGSLSEESYKALEKAGINRTLVDAFIAGQEARFSQYEASVKQLAGGDEAYTNMIEWAKTNLSEDEIDAYDEAVNSQDMRKAKFAVQGLSARYQAEQSQAPSRQLAGKGSANAKTSYESVAQML